MAQDLVGLHSLLYSRIKNIRHCSNEFSNLETYQTIDYYSITSNFPIPLSDVFEREFELGVLTTLFKTIDDLEFSSVSSGMA